MRNPLTRVSDRYVPTPIPLDALEPTEVRDCYRLGPSIIAPGTDRGHAGAAHQSSGRTQIAINLTREMPSSFAGVERPITTVMLNYEQL